jgi:tetratricopeptide (TPR) repeat protein
MSEAGLPRFEVDEQRRKELLPALQAVAVHPTAARLCQALALAEGFSLNLIACPSPLVAQALILWLQEAVPKVRREDVKMVRVTPARSDEARTAELLSRQLFDSLDAEDPTPHALFLDATDSRSDDRPAWLTFFQRLNERRNHLEILGAPLTLLLPLDLDESLPLYAPDLWSVRSVADSLDVFIGIPATRGPASSVAIPKAAISGYEFDLETEIEHLIERIRETLLAPSNKRSRTQYSSEASVKLRRSLNERQLDQDPGSLRHLIWQTSKEASSIEAAKLLTILAEKLASLERSSLATKIYREAIIPIQEDEDKKQSIIAAKLSFAKILAQDDPEEAQQLLIRDVLPFYKNDDSEFEYAEALTALADIKSRIGGDEEAITLLENALSLYGHLCIPRKEAFVLDRISDILQKRGRLDEALRLRLRLPHLFELFNDPPLEIQALEKLAALRVALGEDQEAHRIYEQQIIPSYRQLKDSTREATAWFELARILEREPQSLQASNHALEDEAIPLLESAGDSNLLMEAYLAWSQINKRLGNTDKASRILRRRVIPLSGRLRDSASREKADTLLAELQRNR